MMELLAFGRCPRCGASDVNLWAPAGVCTECDAAMAQRLASTWLGRLARGEFREPGPGEPTPSDAPIR